MNTTQLHHVLTESAKFYRSFDEKLAQLKADHLACSKLISSLQASHNKRDILELNRTLNNISDRIDKLFQQKLDMIDKLGCDPSELADKCDSVLRSIDTWLYNSSLADTANVFTVHFLGPSPPLEYLSSDNSES